MRIDLPNFAQTFDAAGPGHADIADHGVRLFFTQDAKAGFHIVGRVDPVIGLQEHPQTFARTHFVIDDQDLGEFGGDGHFGREKKLSACR